MNRIWIADARWQSCSTLVPWELVAATNGCPWGAQLSYCLRSWDNSLDSLLSCLQEKSHDAASSSLLIYQACVRKLLRRFNGYECQEADGSFMVVFKYPSDAAFFCLMVICWLQACHAVAITKPISQDFWCEDSLLLWLIGGSSPSQIDWWQDGPECKNMATQYNCRKGRLDLQ